MTDEAPTFKEWAIVELMGHRRLGAFVSEQVIAGAPLLRIDVPNRCSGITATHCPACGDCTCPAGNSETERTLDDDLCPLHGFSSPHGEGWAATQFYGVSAIYCITPVTEEVARAVASANQPEPVARWELAAARLPDGGPF